jgi:hypothetical protein
MLFSQAFEKCRINNSDLFWGNFSEKIQIILIEQMRLICLTFFGIGSGGCFFIIYFSKSISLLSDGKIWQSFDVLLIDILVLYWN